MTIDKRIGKKVPSWADPTKVIGAVTTPGPYIGIVKNNVDPNRSGRVQVFIPDFGGNEDEESHWITIQYASPYMGSTRWPTYKSQRPEQNEYPYVNHTYGMWMTPPDIGNFVLTIFVSGDINRGYWFACVMPELTHHGLPTIAGSMVPHEKPKDTALAAALTTGYYPVVEFNDSNPEFKDRWGDFLTIPKPVHEDLIYRLLLEGLEDDKVRGVVSSSSQRESPSAVFGISTPGRAGPNKDKETSAVLNRKGGHSIVLDDGDVNGTDQMIRLRTAGGHQILMNDAEEVIYIANSTGTAWMEFTAEGKMHFYAESDVNIRTGSNFNLHSDNDINMHAERNINMHAGQTITEQAGDKINLRAEKTLNMFGGETNLSSGSTLKLHAGTIGSWKANSDLIFKAGKIYLNTMDAPSVTKPTLIPSAGQRESIKTKPEPIFKWKQTGTVQTTIPGPIPTHEPCDSLHGQSHTVSTGSGAPLTDSQGNPISTGSSPVPSSVTSAGIRNPATAATLAQQPPNVNGVGSLTAAQTTALKAQMGLAESGMNYNADNTKIVNGKATLGYIGKYQFGAEALAAQGYVKPGTSLQGMNNPDNWTGKDGIGSKADFLAAHDVQEKIMDVNLQSNFNALKASKTITSESSPDDIAGKLSVAHLLGAGGTNKWAKGQGGSDANGTTGDMYYNKGRYAVNVLAGTPPTTG
jgi:hypothetical protein